MAHNVERYASGWSVKAQPGSRHSAPYKNRRVTLLPTVMGNSKKKAATASKASKSSAKSLQVKKNQAASLKYKRKPKEDEDDNLDSEEPSDTLPSCKSCRKHARHTTDDDISVVDVDDVESQRVSDNNETSSDEEVQAWKPFCYSK